MPDKSKVFRAVKENAYKNTLQPAGFIKGKHLFLRHQHGQIHSIDFQTSKWGGKYFVNVGFHYDFLPPLTGISNGTKYGREQFELTDFMLYARLEALMRPDYPRSWKYEDNMQGLDEQVDRNARDAVRVLDDLGHKWPDPAVFLKLLPPKLLQEDAKEESSQSNLSAEEAASRPPLPYERALGAAWTPPDYLSLGYCLSIIALRAGHKNLAKEYLIIAEQHSEGIAGEALSALRRE